jgi:hypothetical protein
MSDKLKEFIEDNRDAFDTQDPGPQVLKELKKEWKGDHSNEKISIVKSLRWVAAVAGLIIVSAVFYFILQKKDDKTIIVNQPAETHETEESGIPDPAYAKQIYYFREIIGLKQAELKQLEKEQPELYKQFIHDINKLDSSYRELKTTLAENPNTEILMEAMIQNLQLQSDLLNRQLLIIKEIKQKSKTHEKSTI